ncbi:MAG: nucleotide sugar dehydrogenase [Dehalococcoidia bacterium]|nr:nucleotide sugar dehydrogenase [Dehalococcoidia bacterium]
MKGKERVRNSDLLSVIRAREARIAVIGLGYVGLPLAVEAARVGFTVVGIERNPESVDRVNSGESYIPDVPGPQLAEVVREGRLRATQGFDAIAGVNVIIICVPTPLDKNRNPDTSYIKDVIDCSLPHLNRGQLMVLESTTYPGTTEEIILPHLEARGFTVGEDFHLAFSPERIDPGNKHYGLKDIPKVVGGVTPRCTEAAKTLYETILENSVFTVSSPRVAEMTKLLENTFRVVNVSLVNELAVLCDRMGIDIWEVIEAAKTKPFGFMPFYPGPGMGGHCIPVDPFYLVWKAKEYGFATRFIELAGEINDNMPEYTVNRAAEVLNGSKKALNGSHVLLLGVAYKRDVGDLRESPALKVAHLLLRRGALLSYHDPYVSKAVIDGKEFRSVPLTVEALRGSDLALITTDHSSVDYRLIVEHAPLIYDTRNALANHQGRHIHRLGAMLSQNRQV